jgi:N-acetylmuramoyl-L-alanine amidase
MSRWRAAGLLLAAGLCLASVGAWSAPHVGIQAGHWQIADLPSEQWRLRTDTGASWGGIQEVDANLEIARRVADLLEADGVQVDLLPAAIPLAYSADALVSIHAEGEAPAEGSAPPRRPQSAAPPRRSGWKIAEPWVASDASRLLRADLARAYGAVTGLAEDRYGITSNMRGYYAFDWTRFFHCISPTTPAVLVETGFLGSSADRRIIVDNPEIAAVAISVGIMQFLKDETRLSLDHFVPDTFFRTTVTAPNTVVRFYPGDTERVVGRLPAGTEVTQLSRRGGWAEIVVRRDNDFFGWVPERDLAPPP